MGHRFVSEANLTTRIKEIRRAVGDDGVRQHTIKNLRGRGYRFVADVAVYDQSLRAQVVSGLIAVRAGAVLPALDVSGLSRERVATLVAGLHQLPLTSIWPRRASGR